MATMPLVGLDGGCVGIELFGLCTAKMVACCDQLLEEGQGLLLLLVGFLKVVSGHYGKQDDALGGHSV